MTEVITDHELRPIGDVIKAGPDGYLQKTVSLETIQSEFKPLLDNIVQKARGIFDTNLHSVYVRGSVAKGAFIPGISDLDLIVVTKEDCGDEAEEAYVAAIKAIEPEHPDIEGIEKAIRTVDEFVHGRNPVFKYSTVCLYGDDLADQIPAIKPGQDVLAHVEKTLGNIDKNLPRIADQTEPKRIKEWSTWACKQHIRTAHELVAKQKQEYARDIYPCYKAVSGSHPDDETLLRHCAEIAVFGTNDIQELLKVTKSMQQFLRSNMPGPSGT